MHVHNCVSFLYTYSQIYNPSRLHIVYETPWAIRLSEFSFSIVYIVFDQTHCDRKPVAHAITTTRLIVFLLMNAMHLTRPFNFFPFILGRSECCAAGKCKFYNDLTWNPPKFRRIGEEANIYYTPHTHQFECVYDGEYALMTLYTHAYNTYVLEIWVISNLRRDTEKIKHEIRSQVPFNWARVCLVVVVDRSLGLRSDNQTNGQRIAISWGSSTMYTEQSLESHTHTYMQKLYTQISTIHICARTRTFSRIRTTRTHSEINIYGRRNIYWDIVHRKSCAPRNF